MTKDNRIWVLGGRARPDAADYPAWAMFDQAVLIELQDGAITRRLEYAGSDLERKLGISRCFKAASVHGDEIWACTNTEVLRISINNLEVVDAWSHPLFNDLHHVALIGDNVHVVSTGIDSVLEFDRSMQLRRRIGVAEDEIILRFGLDSDFRLIPTTKPHAAHPNFVASWSDGVWVTRFAQRDVLNLHTGTFYPLAETPVHDGVPAHGWVWFTTVKGAVIRLDPETGSARTSNLMQFYLGARPIGWCRGILPLSEHEAIVGFSKLRPTQQAENVGWVRSALSGMKDLLKQPTRIARFDLEQGRELWTRELANDGIDAIFSLNHPEV